MRNILSILLVLVLLSVGIRVFSQNRTNFQQANPSAQQEQKTDEVKQCGKPLVTLTEGPYYKTGSPQRQTITAPGTAGKHLILKGFVLDAACNPVKNAWLDFWQADGNGNYDNEGYNLRGHQYTNEDGFFRLETVVPGEYPGRTPHIHFKVRQTEDSPTLTSQLFIPGNETNSADAIYDESLVVKYGTDSDGSKNAGFTIVLPN